MCPVSDAWIAISAVSRSRISPTRILSGSWRRIDRRQLAKVTPMSGLIGTWIRPSISYSTGSSVVMILSSISLSSLRAAYSVVVLPEPVGPVTRMMPLGFMITSIQLASVSSGMPSLLRSSWTTERSRIRSTTLSPNMVGRVETRMSTLLPPRASSIRPSCGSRRSAMSRLDMTLMRLAMAGARWRGGGTIS